MKLIMVMASNCIWAFKFSEYQYLSDNWLESISANLKKVSSCKASYTFTINFIRKQIGQIEMSIENLVSIRI